MESKVAREVHQIYSTICNMLGEAFSLDALVTFTKLHRGKPLLIEQDSMVVAISGYCLALQDVDLICTRAGMDKILEQTVQLHEISHLLLGHIPLLSNGSDTPSYTTFRQHREEQEGKIYRSHATAYDAPQEYAAETLATLLLHSILKEENSMPSIIEEFFG
jgi:hypothetical protein